MIINYPIYENIKIKDYLSKFYISKSKIYKLFLNKQILINNHIANENDLLKKGDILSIDFNENIDYKPSSNNINILFEDDYFLIVNKKRGIIIHDDTNSLCNDIAKYYYDNGITLTIKYPNRIDKDTSGIMIFCKDMLTHSYMNHLYESHDIVKEYQLFVNGKLKNKKGIITYRIGKDRHISGKMRVSSTGVDAITEYKVIKEYDNYSLVKCNIKTGRTHQIRVHMSYLGNPILGDKLYGDNSSYSNNLLLHHSKVEFIHPIYNEKIEIICDLPIDMKELY